MCNSETSGIFGSSSCLRNSWHGIQSRLLRAFGFLHLGFTDLQNMVMKSPLVTIMMVKLLPLAGQGISPFMLWPFLLLLYTCMKNLTFFLVTYFLCGRLISDPTETISAAPTALPEDDFPEVELFVPSVYPPSEDDVIPFPYNTVLALEELNEHADCQQKVKWSVLESLGQQLNKTAQ